MRQAKAASDERAKEPVEHLLEDIRLPKRSRRISHGISNQD
jgi:hypothetical protein